MPIARLPRSSRRPLAVRAAMLPIFGLALAALAGSDPLAPPGDARPAAPSAPIEPASANGATQASAVALPPLSLALPIACEPGVSCFIQSYVDHDPGPGALDFRCNQQTYDGHTGTDFRLPSLADAGKVEALAAAAGTVRAVRDTVADQLPEAIDLAGTSGAECGNGLVIDHGEGWETQYCHLRQGSLRVAAGDRLRAGQALGTVGLSGNTEFAHLHFSVRHQGRSVDPFAPAGPPPPGRPASACKAQPASLWDTATSARLGYARSIVLNKGFAIGALTMARIERGAIPQPDRASPTMVAYARVIHLQAGDILTLTLHGPGGELLADTATQRLDRHKAQWMLFTGLRRRGESWPRGRYSARVAIRNAGQTLLEERFFLTL